MSGLVTLRPGDEGRLDAFLARHAESSMFLRSNARASGLADRGEPFQGTYVAAIEQDAIVGVAAHYWNGMVVLQAPSQVEAVAREAARRSGRKLAGLTGPWPQVVAARKGLGLERVPATKDGKEGLYALELTRLVVPAAFGGGRVKCRHSRPEDLDLLTEWRVAFSIEALGLAAEPALEEAARADVRLHHRRGTDWVLLDQGVPVAYALFNAALPDIVQVGGVWTPPELRGKGYGRAVVAGALIAVQREGVQRAVLFADDPAAVRAYEAIGFRRVGEYGLTLFRDETTLG